MEATRVRCKVRCMETGKRHSPGAEGDLVHTAKFAAVYDSNPNSENGRFFKYTPNATIDLGVIQNQHFEAGDEYYLDFVPVKD